MMRWTAGQFLPAMIRAQGVVIGYSGRLRRSEPSKSASRLHLVSQVCVADTRAVNWHLIAIPGVLALVFSWCLAAVVLATGPGLRRDRLLALLLVVEGTAWATGSGFLYLAQSPETARYLQAIFVGMLLMMPACSLAFAGTLPTPLMAPLRSQAVLALMALLTIAAEILYISHPDRLIGAIVPAWYATWDADLPALTVGVFNFVGLVGLVTLAGALSAWRRSPRGSWERRQARAFTVAFCAHDLGMFCALVLPGHVFPPPPSGNLSDLFVILGSNFTSIAFVLLLSYGILKVQLFDVDLRIKRGIRRSTVAAVFVASFLIVEQLVQSYFAGQFGVLLGAMAAGLMLFFLGHIRHFAERFANGVMPDVSPTPEYVAYRKLEVYRAAFEGLYADAVVSDKERATLDRLRIKLAIQPADALAIEAEVRSERELANFAQPGPATATGA